jgi:hypothetical protein
MNKGIAARALVGLALISLVVCPVSVYAQKQKIKVIVADASIRVGPTAGSEIISHPPRGSVFEVEGKVGDWYEVKVQTEVGPSITGYIYEMFVEVVKAAEEATAPKIEAPKPPPTPPAPVKRDEPAEETPEPRSRPRFSAKAIGVYAFRQGYDYVFTTPYLGETLTITDSVSKYSALGGHADVGLFIRNNVELTAGMGFLTKTLAGLYSFELPNMYIYDDLAYDEVEGHPAVRMTSLDLGVNLYLGSGGALKPYIGGGASYVMARMGLLEDMEYTETYYADDTHTIEITTLWLTTTNIKKLGFFVRGGLAFEFSRHVAFVLDGTYVMAKAVVPHLLTSVIDASETISIDLGGMSGGAGFRFTF